MIRLAAHLFRAVRKQVNDHRIQAGVLSENYRQPITLILREDKCSDLKTSSYLPERPH